MKTLQLSSLTRSTSTTSTTSTRKILPSDFNGHHTRAFSAADNRNDLSSGLIVVRRQHSSPASEKRNSINKISSFLLSLLASLPSPLLFRRRGWFSNISSGAISVAGRKLTGTLFGHRHGHVSFAVQLDPRSEPIALLELDISTASLVKEMSSGLLRIALECEKVPGSVSGSGRARKLLQESKWTMYCNGRKRGVAVSRTCGACDQHVLNTVRSVSVGAGVIPVVGDGGESELGELLYMRAKFERVVGSRDSEALYMVNPDGNGGPELSIFLLRI